MDAQPPSPPPDSPQLYATPPVTASLPPETAYQASQATYPPPQGPYAAPWPGGGVWPPASVTRPSPSNGGSPVALAVGAAILALVLATAALLVALGHRPAAPAAAATSGTIQVNTTSIPVPQGSVASVAQSLAPAVGTIVSTNASDLSGRSGASGLGSGFVISNSASTSYLLTNNHVVAGSASLEVIMSSGKVYPATLVGTDTVEDLAVVSVTDGHLPQATFGRSADLVAGQAVVAIGSPLGNQNSVTSGVISALHRSISAGDQSTGSSESLGDVLQTDAPINPGNSGGPLADMSGRVVGVNVATSSGGTNVSFSIPADPAQIVADDLINHRTVDHPYLGVSSLTTLDAAEQGRPFNGPGVDVTTVAPGSPAAAAGLQTGDIIVSVDGVTLDGNQTLGGIMARHRVGDTVHLAITRDSRSLTLTAIVGQRPNA